MSEPIDNWADDKLNRKACATFLTNYLTKRFSLAEVKKKPDTLVLNIRAKWGFGKTFFVDRWIKDLRDLDFPVVHFDAWANDFSEDPLIGFIAAIDQSLSKHYKSVPAIKRNLDIALGSASKLIKPISLGIAGALTRRLANHSLEEIIEILNDEGNDEDQEDAEEKEVKEKGIASDIKTVIASSAKAAIKEHQNKQQTIKLFKKRLGRLIEALTKEPNVQLPLFVFIDELDRCRPLYAIELLEAIKHLFGVPGIYFIVSTNLEQLGHSIRAVYGEQFESERYLKRFFDLEYQIPDPDRTHFTALLFDKYSLNDFPQCFVVIEKHLYNNPTPLQVLFGAMIRSFDLGLRDEQQIAESFQSILLSWQSTGNIHVVYLLLLIIVRHISTADFEEIGRNPSAYVHEPSDRRHLGRIMAKNVIIKVDSPVSAQSHINAPRTGYSGKASTFDLVREYLNLVHTESDKIQNVNPNEANKFPGKIKNAIIAGASSSPNSGDVALSDYHRIVSQAGQLTSTAVSNMRG